VASDDHPGVYCSCVRSLARGGDAAIRLGELSGDAGAPVQEVTEEAEVGLPLGGVATSRVSIECRPPDGFVWNEP
jgi:hypothetical protein